MVSATARCAAGPGARSRDHLGAEYEWIPDRTREGVRWALDVERLQGRVSPLASAEEGEVDFLVRWTRAEVAAKLTGTPILAVWRRLAAGLAGAEGSQAVELDGTLVETTVWRHGDLVLCTGSVG